MTEVESRTQCSRPRLRTKKKIRGKEPTFRIQTLSRPRTEMLEATAKDQQHNFASGIQKKRLSRRNRIFSAKFQAILKKERKVIELKTEGKVKFSLVIFLFHESKNNAALESKCNKWNYRFFFITSNGSKSNIVAYKLTTGYDVWVFLRFFQLWDIITPISFASCLVNVFWILVFGALVYFLNNSFCWTYCPFADSLCPCFAKWAFCAFRSCCHVVISTSLNVA